MQDAEKKASSPLATGVELSSLLFLTAAESFPTWNFGDPGAGLGRYWCTAG